MEIALRLGECCLSCHLMRFKAEKEALKWLSKAVFERAWQCVVMQTICGLVNQQTVRWQMIKGSSAYCT